MHGRGETPREEEGAPPRPQPAPAGAPPGTHTADVPTCLPGAARHQGQDPTDFTGTQPVPPGQEGLGQSDSQGASGHQGSRRSVLPLSWGPGLAGALRPLPASPCLCASGTEGLWGGQCGPGRDARTPGLGVVPKIVNQGNHQGAHTDGNSRGFLYKLELGCNCTQHSGAGTWILRLRGIAAL